MLILHSTTLLNLFISSARFFLVDSLGFFYIQNHLIDSLLLTSQSRCLLFFSCLTAVARTSSTILNRSGNGGRLCLIPDVQEKAFSLSPQSMMLAIACLCFKTSALNWYHYETSPRRKGYHTKCSVYKNEHRKKTRKKQQSFLTACPEPPLDRGTCSATSVRPAGPSGVGGVLWAHQGSAVFPQTCLYQLYLCKYVAELNFI